MSGLCSHGVGIGINICEDIWYQAGPATVQADAGAECY